MNQEEYKQYIVDYSKEIVKTIDKDFGGWPLHVHIALVIGQLTAHLIKSLCDKGHDEDFIRQHLNDLSALNLNSYFDGISETFK